MNDHIVIVIVDAYIQYRGRYVIFFFFILVSDPPVRPARRFLCVGGVAPGVVRGLVLAAEMAAKTAAATGGDAPMTLVAPKARGRPPTPGGKNAMKR